MKNLVEDLVEAGTHIVFSKVRTERFKSTFFSSCSVNWNQLGLNIQNSSSLEIFKRALLSFNCKSMQGSSSKRIKIINTPAFGP